ncbi:diguanylate cyclase [Pseudosulfitobacter koreensis]|uniref:diguanylate cyclase n=1 Tax=Pseudosulfitobacter koreensis TaxID=2968472 RepID=A0ABT1Z4T6_9RHOB|nr:diguanylate cyclase [Pseudosulfitobacter koreense]MCR8828146.1 diguanylate cyclase [Pseudosulfitobacter koreense]
MHAKILIVDAIATNRIVLKVKLAAAHYEVLQASTLTEALRLAVITPPDMVICAADLPDGSADDLVRLLRSDTQPGPMPVLAVAPDISTARRLDLLEAGVNDVITDIYHDTLLLARVRSMLRAQTAETEWQIREDTTRALGLAEDRATFVKLPNITVVCPSQVQSTKATAALRKHMVARLVATVPKHALTGVRDSGDPETDIFILIADANESEQMLALVSSIRTHVATRHSAVLLTYPDDAPMLAARALDLGVNALTQANPDPRELAIRVRELMQRKLVADQLRATVRTGLEAAVSDPLTGLHNRRYAMPHLARLAERSGVARRPFALMLADLDHFKRVNDIYGHATGDAVLIETARRLRDNLRSVDLLARVGGEEFLIVLPGVSLGDARSAARRLCRQIGDTPFETADGRMPINVTISIGLAIGGLPDDAALATQDPQTVSQQLMARADKALYEAKVRGRNCVKLSRPAA